MAWTTPRTWTTGELVTKTIMDAHIRDNLNALKNPPSGNVDLDAGSDYTLTATNFVYIDSDVIKATITTTGGDVLLVFNGVLKNVTTGARCYLTFDQDNVRIPDDDGLMLVIPNTIAGATTVQGFCMMWLVTGLDAGTYIFRVKWKTSAGTVTLYSGAGTTNYDLHPQFWAREIS